jgi:kynurenine formamidase
METIKKNQFIDLSIPLGNDSVEPIAPKIKYINHKKGAKLLILGSLLSKSSLLKTISNLIAHIFNKDKVTIYNFPSEEGLAWEHVKAGTHAGTHLDAPWHFGSSCEGKRSRTIDEIPLHWCYGYGVVLNLLHKKAGSLILVNDLKQALKSINYSISPGNIVLIMTGADKHHTQNNYLNAHPGISREATLWLLEKGVKIIGTDGWGFDRPFKKMIKDYQNTKDNRHLWPGHFAGREKEYCHIESMTNLDKLPPTGFKVICFPVKISKASAGWVRAVAILEE